MPTLDYPKNVQIVFALVFWIMHYFHQEISFLKRIFQDILRNIWYVNIMIIITEQYFITQS